MLRKIFSTGGLTLHPWRMLASRHSSSVSNATVDSLILHSLKEHYHEVSKMTPPPKISPPAGFSILKGALNNDGPVLRKIYGENEEVLVTVIRVMNILPGDGGKGYDDELNQLFLHVDITKPGVPDSLHFLCGLYPDAIGIHTISLRPKPGKLGIPQISADPRKYGPDFHALAQNMKDVLHFYIEERGVDESLFTFLQAWLYVKDHRSLLGWFKIVGTFISDKDSSEAASKLE